MYKANLDAAIYDSLRVSYDKSKLHFKNLYVRIVNMCEFLWCAISLQSWILNRVFSNDSKHAVCDLKYVE
jgi:hypothetical protein